MRNLWALMAFGLAALASQVTPTQYLANLYGNAEGLGEPLVAFKQWAMYSPLAWWEWSDRWRATDPQPFGVAEILYYGCLVGGLAAVLAIKKLGVSSRRHSQEKSS